MTAAREIKPAAFRPGQRLTVVDASPYAGPKGKPVTPPFSAGDTVTCDQSGPTTLRITTDPRLWKAARFVAAT